jgi:succinate dehydrogenase / fumarate reductase cytochrome b subunit
MPDLASKPLSPHLSIYRLSWLMTASIVHRLTGAALYFGFVLIAVWLSALAAGEEAYGLFQRAAFSWPGLVILFGYSWALIQHMLGGIRHLIWDQGLGLEVPTARLLAIASFMGSAILTLLLWFFAGALA